MTHPTPAQPRTPDSPTPALAGPYAPGQPMPSDEQITAYLEMESYMARALAHTTDGSSIEERAAIAVRFVRAAVAEPSGKAASVPHPALCRCGHPMVHHSTLGCGIEGCACKSWWTVRPSAFVPASPPAPQPEAATGAECNMCGALMMRGKNGLECPNYECDGPDEPPPPTVETAEAPPPPGVEPAPDPLEAEDIACIRHRRAASRVVLMYDDEYSDTPRRWPWESYMDADPARIAKAREKSTLPNVATRRPRLYVRDDAEWRSVPLVVLPTRVDEQTAPTVTLPLADAEDIDRVLALSGWDRSCKGAIVLREAIERAKP